MKKQFSIALLLGSMFSFSQIGLGTTTPNPSAQLDVTSTTKGFLIPRIANNNQTAIPSPAPGLQIWCMDCGTGQLQVRNNGTWISNPSATGVLPICGAKTTTGTFLVFMCHNLGVDTSLDPFTYQGGAINGDFYQWGRRKDGHQLRNSETINIQATNNTATTPTTIIGKFINIQFSDWRSELTNTLWGDGTESENPAKAANDPCPPGFKVPSRLQWISIINSTEVWTDTGTGYMVGALLYLPKTGYRSDYDGSINAVGGEFLYWSSTPNGTDSVFLSANSGGRDTGTVNRANGFSVRCVSE